MGPTIYAHGKRCTCHDCGGPRIPSPCIDEAMHIVESHELGRWADAGFDGGEFSGPAHDSMIDESLAKLAKRYDVDVDDLRDAMYERETFEHSDQP